MTIIPPATLPIELPPFGGLKSLRGHLPLTAMDVRAEIAGLLATTRVRQTFVNSLDEHVEATYIFPLPDRAGVTSFVAVLGGRRIEGVLKERQAARDDYDEAIAAGCRAALLEEDRPGVFTATVGNVAPGETAEIELVLTGPLPYDGGQATYRFPLVVAPRYIPGRPLDGPGAGRGTELDTDLVPDASRISPPVLLPGQPNPVDLSLEVTIDPLGLPLGNLRSSLHAALVDDTRVVLVPGERLNRDFVLHFTLAGAVRATTAAFAPDTPDAGEGTFSVTVVPPSGPATREPLDVAVVLDRSGSMGGWKMVAARRAAARIVDTLTAADRFLVLAFDHAVEHPTRLGDGLVDGTDRNRYAAVEFLSGLEARGGTELHHPVQQAAATLAAAAGDRDATARRGVLVLVTDGQIGQEDHVLRQLRPSLDRVRVFTVGIDRAVNAGFLNRLADAGRGRCELVESEDALDDAMTRIHRAVSPPVVEDVTVRLHGAELIAGTTNPARPADIHEGAPCMVSGRFRGRPNRIELHGRRADGSRWTETVTPLATENPALRTAWARSQVRTLEDRYAAQPGDVLAEQITSTSLTHGVLSRFTAFVAVDPSEPTGSTSPLPVVQPVELPDAWAGSAGGGVQPMAAMNLSRPLRAMAGAAEAPPLPPANPDAALERLLDRVEEWLRSPDTPATTDRDDLARELLDLAFDESRDDLRRAVTELAAAVQSWDGVARVARKVKAVRNMLTRRRRFWR
jgi:Ca-activated chloride channel family protein